MTTYRIPFALRPYDQTPEFRWPEIVCHSCRRGHIGHARNGECIDKLPAAWRPYGGLR